MVEASDGRGYSIYIRHRQGRSFSWYAVNSKPEAQVGQLCTLSSFSVGFLVVSTDFKRCLDVLQW